MEKNLEKEFCSYEQALALKELGFDEKCLANYLFNKELEISFYRHGMDIPAPLKQQVFRWFREMYGAHIHPRRILPNVYIAEYGLWTSEAFKTYEEAENACIDKLIEIAKQQDNGTSD
jgi:hypothetical protein